MVQLHYDLGSINYKLQGYSDAIEYYKEAVNILEANLGDKYWSQVINGNLGLAYLRANQNEKGKVLLDHAK
jgi:tetratricopeptide (TPR) repeat protein